MTLASRLDEASEGIAPASGGSTGSHASSLGGLRQECCQAWCVRIAMAQKKASHGDPWTVAAAGWELGERQRPEATEPRAKERGRGLASACPPSCRRYGGRLWEVPIIGGEAPELNARMLAVRASDGGPCHTSRSEIPGEAGTVGVWL